MKQSEKQLGRRLTRVFFQRHSVTVARDLVGCYFTRELDDGTRLVVRLVEVEAYLGDGTDPASHAHRGETPHNRTMFGPAGHLYVYRSYGIHACANIVCTGKYAAAVLLRAAEPVAGIEAMRRNRALSNGTPDTAILRGPGNFCRALGISTDDDGLSLLSGPVAVHLPPARHARPSVVISTRIGITKAVELPYRFFAANDPHVSAAKRGMVAPRARRRS
jgi:DNA-3-methyladenine glycosylase